MYNINYFAYFKELKEGLSKVGVDFYGQIKNAWSSLSKLPMLGTSSSTPSIEATTTTTAAIATTTLVSTETEPSQVNNEKQEKVTDPVEKVDFGKINKGRRIDYVLQEKPIESFNEYLFALASHACYWLIYLILNLKYLTLERPRLFGEFFFICPYLLNKNMI